MKRKSQMEKVLELLQKGYPVTPMSALYAANCYRLGARIFDLRRKGYNIVTDKSKGYATYALEKEATINDTQT